MKFKRKIAPEIKSSPKFITKKRLREDEINFSKLRSYRLDRVKKELEKIQEDILNLKKSLLNFNFQKFSGQLEKTSQIKNVKKQIARLKTKLSNVGGENNA